MNPIEILLEIQPPVHLFLDIAPGVHIIPAEVISQEPLFTTSEAARFEPGDKARLDLMITPGQGERLTGIHPGAVGEMSLTDDYLFVCVKPGGPGLAIWKRTVLFATI